MSLNIKRIIPVLFIKNGFIVKSSNFNFHQIIGNPIEQASRLNDYNVDELIYIDISKLKEYDINRDDHKIKINNDILDIILDISRVCYMPLSFGGNIHDSETARKFIHHGADKIIINKMLFDEKELKKTVQLIGSQAIIASIDYKVISNKKLIFQNSGSKNTGIDLLEFIKYISNCGVGELFLQNIDYDGSAKGYDLDTIQEVLKISKIPVIACSGAGNEKHFVEVLKFEKLSAVAAGNYFNFKEHSYPNLKKILKENKINVR